MNNIQSASTSLKTQVEALDPFLDQLKQATTIEEKLELLNNHPDVKQFLDKFSSFKTYITGLSPEANLAVKSLLAIGQGPALFSHFDEVPDKYECLNQVIEILLSVENFYHPIGGIVGYHVTV